MRYLFFLGIVLVTVGGTHYYFWTRLTRDTGLPASARLVLALVLLLLALSLPASFFIFRALSPSAARTVLFPVYIWMGLMLLLTAFFFATDLLRWGYQLVVWIAGHPVRAEQRQLIGRVQALVVLGAAVVAAVASIIVALGTPTVRRLEVTLPGLPARLDGLRLVQLTDLHVGAILGRRWLEGVVEQVNELAPDVVAITGDLVDGRVSRLRPVVEPLKRLRPPQGSYFVTGNHEYYSGVLEWMEEMPRLGLKVLHNQRARIGGQDGFDLAGVDDASAAGMGIPGHGANLPAALSGRRPTDALVLLAHQPKAVLEASRAGVGLQLSGHTHGGQIWPWRYLVRLQQPVVRGLRRFGDTLVYVSDGTGFWGPPMRLGTRAEITLITLRAPSKSRDAVSESR
jgi:uncharacterized protein